MSHIDKIIEREFAKKNDRSFDKSRFVRCYGQKELRALLQEVHDAAVAEAGKDPARLRSENDRMREIIAASNLPCVYCKLPADQWSQCSLGFPGCARGDDLMCGPNMGMSKDDDATIAAAKEK